MKYFKIYKYGFQKVQVTNVSDLIQEIQIKSEDNDSIILLDDTKVKKDSQGICYKATEIEAVEFALNHCKKELEKINQEMYNALESQQMAMRIRHKIQTKFKKLKKIWNEPYENKPTQRKVCNGLLISFKRIDESKFHQHKAER